VSTLLLNKEKVKRSPSLRSEQSSLSESRHVSFNQDVSIKRIPKKAVKTKSLPLDPNDEFQKKCQEFVNIPPPSDQEQIADEAEQILRQLDDIECSVSPTPRIESPVRHLVSPTPSSSKQTTPFSSRNNTLEKRRNQLFGGRLSKSSSDLVKGSLGRDRVRAMRVDGHSEQEDSPGPVHNDNRFYGLQALSNLDNAVNGKLNNLYRDSSGSTDYSPPPKKNNYTPPKPPRKAPSASPPSIRRGYTSHDDLDFKCRNSEMYESSGNPKEEMDPSAPYSYTGANPSLNHLRNSPTRYINSRQSPSRGNHTDSEILSSPTQVLYATISADKHKHNGNLKNQHIVHSSSQTIQSGFRPVSAERQIKSRTLSKENILDDPPYRQSNGNGGSSKHGSRSLERFVDEDKENFKRTQELKARIHVSSPMRYTPERQVSRKPYKTTINTATDTIQYKGFSSENLIDKNDPRHKLRHSGKKVDTEHYKVPKNKAPVPADFIARKGIRTDSENSSSAYNGNYHIPEKNSNVKSQFASTSLVRNVERGNKRGEYDREGRRIHTERRSTERNRAYSGYSTSPDREISPDRYAKPRGSKIQLTHRSPSSSPTRPPRTRSSPNREIQIPIRREHSGRDVERSPSTRAAATSRSPIKKIQRVHNEIKGDKKDREPSPHKTRTLTLTRNKGDKSGARGVKTIMAKKEEKSIHEDDRLSKFTEYRGGSEEPTRSMSNGRRGSTGHELRKEPDNNHFDRERGQSVPPGANIDSMRDFYKTNQYRSMYHLPPSPSRPAPVLDRAGKTQTLERATLHRERSGDFIIAPPRRLAKTSISEGELTDDQARQDRVIRQRNKFLNNMMNKNGEQSTMNRRVVSSDREADGKKIYGELNNRRNGSNERPLRRPAPQPPTQKVRRSSVDVLETSHSESESPRPDQAKLGVESGGRWGTTGQSDIEADYRRELATNSVHMEARSRDGGIAPPSIYQQAATLNRNKSASKTKIDNIVRGKSNERITREVEISQDDDEDEIVKAPPSLSREEERRKIIELEEERRRKEIKPVNNVSRSGSKVTKMIGAKSKGPKHGAETENESQYSGHSSSSVKKDAVLAKTRYNTNNGRVKRTGSSATTSSARQVISRKKMPGSVTSSVNSSESEHGSAGQSAISRGTNQSNQSNRSVYLHATAVADIPSSKPLNSGENKMTGSNLQKSKKISRSISLLAPFKKQAPKEKEVLYDSSGQITHSGKPPRAPPPPARRIPGPNDQPMSRDKKFASSSDLLQDENEVVMSYPEDSNSKSSSKVSRSVSMPKDTRLAGWFKKRKRV